ncbi:uncharacterized protein LOC130451662 [Diorhabda sublineata]|uniref:uncharacterized protein LOC130451662 n=1 Tax=Diorhabda sublineata TaxID=1163346 RepID=UPI0024E1746E|nr:uncharacterized protein LOC130451662 [Diorhabda sublineata]
MYRPPINNNRVKSIRKKFENSENNKSPERKNGKNCDSGDRNPNKNNERLLADEGTRLQFNNSGEVVERKQIEKDLLQRQLSDPAKRNIKRTPAFRVDKSAERTSAFQRNSNQSTLYESKVKQFSAVKNNCDNNSNVLTKTSEIKPLLNIESDKSNNIKKPVLLKSQSSIEFQSVRSKFSNDITKNLCNDCHDSTKNSPEKSMDISLLYTEPIPKALRRNNSNCTDITSLPVSAKKDCIYSVSTMKIEEKLLDIKKRVSLTDSLKVALSRPLPKGPAPKKPPRTFQALNIQESIELPKNISFLHTKQIEKKPPSRAFKKADPKYMLIRLEDAVRNNKLKGRKQLIDKSLTSGEDSDDSMIVHTKSNRTLPKLPCYEENSNTSALNFNCLKPLRFAVTNYEKIREPNSCFFVGNPHEPVYAEPFHYRKDSLDSVLLKREGSSRSKQSARNSLYYMSTPVLTAGCKFFDNFTETSEKQMSAENSSLSSFTSDVDTSPTEESPKIRRIIECYESGGTTFLHNGQIPSNRVDNLRNSLQQTLDNTFNNINAVRDSDSENYENEKVSEIIRKFETYRQAMPKYCTTKISKDSLFYCCLIIEKGKDIARIKFKYPSNAVIPQNIEHLCFPESDSIPLDMSDLSQNYSLLITDDKGERTYGYCRRVLPEGSNCCLPLTYCILSKYRAPRFYRKILYELESRHGIQTKYRDELISQFYNQKFPKPGESIKINLTNIEPNIYKTDDKENSIKDIEESVDVGSFVPVNRTGDFIPGKNHPEQIFVNKTDIKTNCTIPSYIVQSKEKNELILTLHPDTRFEDSDLKKLHQLPPDILLKIFSSMLLERKVVLISSMISNLSSCIDSLQSILYPFTWHHTCIPVLPEPLWDIVESPTPVLCGVLSNAVTKNYQIENGIVVDLDSMTIQREEGDENKILAQSMKKVWKRSLDLANKAATSLEYVHSVYLSDAYLQVFIMCFKDYKKYFEDGVFHKEEFIKNGKTKGIRKFLNMFTETYMFLAFIDTVLNTPENLTEFDKKIEMYGSEDSNVILDKLLEWNK